MNEVTKRLLVAAVLVSFAASVGLSLSQRNTQIAKRQYMLAQTIGEEICGNSTCEYRSESHESCSVDCALMTLDPTSGPPSSGPVIYISGVPYNMDDPGIQWWAVFEDGSENPFPGQPALDPDGSAKNAYTVPDDTPPQQIRIELRSSDGLRVLAYAWYTVLPVDGGGTCVEGALCSSDRECGGGICQPAGKCQNGSSCMTHADCSDGSACMEQGKCADGSMCVFGYKECLDGSACTVAPSAGVCAQCSTQNGSCGDKICSPEKGEDAVNCPLDCSGTGGGECSFAPFCDVSAGGRCADGTGYSNDGVTCYCGDATCQDLGAHCGQGLCEEWNGENAANCPLDCGTAPTVCGNNVCEWQSGESKSSCPGDCACINCNETADDVWELIVDVDGNDLMFDEYYQQQCASGIDPIVACEMTREKCVMEHPRYGNYDPIKCDDGYQHCLSQSTQQCGAGQEQCGNGLCEPGESPDTCSEDCHGSADKCGDGVCGAAETSDSCPVDCPVTDTDGDGVLDAQDSCPDIAGKPEYMGCPVADKITVDLHQVHVAGGSSTKEPLADVSVRVFDRNNSDFRTIAGSKNPDGSLYGVVFEADMGRVASCTTDETGACLAGEPSVGDLLVIIKYFDPETNKSVYVGRPKSPEDFVDTDDDGYGDLATKDFQILKVFKKGIFQEYRGGSKVVVTGSMLEMILPESAVWDGLSSIYPFIFTSDSTWKVDVCAEVPTGYEIQGFYDESGNFVDSQECVKTFVSGETKVIGFQVLETSSPEPKFVGSVKVKGPKGKKHTQRFNVSDVRKATFKSELLKGLEKKEEMKRRKGVVYAADMIRSNQHTAAGNASQDVIWVIALVGLVISGVCLSRHMMKK